MSESFLAAAAQRSSEASIPVVPATAGRTKIAVLSDKVVDTNPYSRLMCVQWMAVRLPPLPTSRTLCSLRQGAEEDGYSQEL